MKKNYIFCLLLCISVSFIACKRENENDTPPAGKSWWENCSDVVWAKLYGNVKTQTTYYGDSMVREVHYNPKGNIISSETKERGMRTGYETRTYDKEGRLAGIERSVGERTYWFQYEYGNHGKYIGLTGFYSGFFSFTTNDKQLIKNLITELYSADGQTFSKRSSYIPNGENILSFYETDPFHSIEYKDLLPISLKSVMPGLSGWTTISYYANGMPEVQTSTEGEGLHKTVVKYSNNAHFLLEKTYSQTSTNGDLIYSMNNQYNENNHLIYTHELDVVGVIIENEYRYQLDSQKNILTTEYRTKDGTTWSDWKSDGIAHSYTYW